MEKRWFVTGDKHGDITPILQFIERFGLGEESNIIVCGDMGICWSESQFDLEETVRTYEKYCNGVNLFWIDGNHENFNIINEWYKDADAGCYHAISDHITHMYRGTKMTVSLHGDVKTMLFLGGADSVDRFWRREGLDWWPEEQITPDDIQRVHADHYDYVFTHCCPFSVFEHNRGFLCNMYANIDKFNHTSEKMLDLLCNKITYGEWFFGHYHADIRLSPQFRCVFKDFIEL